MEVLNCSEVSSLVLGEEVESLLLNKLSCDFEGNLISPSVLERHGEIVNENSHLLVSDWNEGSGLLSLNFLFDSILVVDWLGSTREVNSLHGHLVLVEGIGVHDDGRGLGSSGSSNQKGVELSVLLSDLTLLSWKVGDLVNDELSSGRVRGWDQKLGESNSLWNLPWCWLPNLPLLG